MELQTMTIDSIFGTRDSKLNWITEEARTELTKITDIWVKHCIENNVETTSSIGAFTSLVLECFSKSQFEAALNYYRLNNTK